MYLEARNNVLNQNPPVSPENITTHGSNLAWAICALHGFLFLGVLAWTFTANARRRIFHYFSLLILLIATIYYYVLASNLGNTAVRIYLDNNIAREVFYARWVGYFINFSLITFALALLSGCDWPGVLFSVVLAMIWAVMYLCGALTVSTYKWGFFVFAVFAQFVLVWQLLLVARTFAGRHDIIIRNTFSTLVLYELGLMTLYAVAWGVSEASNTIENDSEMIFYCVLDVLTQGVFAVLLILRTGKLDLDYLRLAGTDYGRLPHGSATAATGTAEK